MKYNPFKLYVARVKENIKYRVALGSVMFLLGCLGEFVVRHNGEVIFQSHFFGGVFYLLCTMLTFAVLRSVLVAFIVWGCYYGHEGMQELYEDYVEGTKS